ncbi:hypothetical protein K457DRAFT_32412 [Linnemannia elongata AG-77]|uniref:Uncharacterized protein n=1 Tax=Linnemannia elongata AG-77 TaxID=1314771 RepID=A0A197JVL4_9FUNG|nr:hypothetical protein K457DRAFT_32412 [Linnemannia elongata AG-77]
MHPVYKKGAPTQWPTSILSRYCTSRLQIHNIILNAKTLDPDQPYKHSNRNPAMITHPSRLPFLVAIFIISIVLITVDAAPPPAADLERDFSQLADAVTAYGAGQCCNTTPCFVGCPVNGAFKLCC